MKQSESTATKDLAAAFPSRVEGRYRRLGLSPQSFQMEVAQAFGEKRSGLLHAPTGSGKTLALWLPILEEGDRTPGDGLKVLWLTPLRALAKDLQRSMLEAAEGTGNEWAIAAQTGDMSSAERTRLKQRTPDALITTPESLHVMLSREGYPSLFSTLSTIVVDEWHELLHTKRGTLVELALARLRGLRPGLRTWGVSATLSNVEDSLQVLLGLQAPDAGVVVRSGIRKRVEIESLLPEKIETFPWAGHVGLRLLPKVLEVVRNYGTTLIFTNTRSNAETWHRALVEADPALKDKVALHHGSLDTRERQQVEEALHGRKLRAVVCTSSLDLGVDFRPVDAVVQVGSPKGVGRFLQRAGRSGHAPGAISRIFFVPTHLLELIEPPALRAAIVENYLEDRTALEKPLDVLVQYLTTLASGEGFFPAEVLREVLSCQAYRSLSPEEWQWALDYITRGGDTLASYDRFRKVEIGEDGLYQMQRRALIHRHRMSIGTILSEASLRVRFIAGETVGTVEESFASRLNAGDQFFFGGRALEFVRLRETTVWVRSAKGRKGIVPRWYGGRMPLSSQLAERIRNQLVAGKEMEAEPEMQLLRPILELQARHSAVPGPGQFLIEKVQSREGHHLFLYPFEGRLAHEGLAAILAWRLSREEPATFSFAMNDYGLELLSAHPVDIEAAIGKGLFREENILDDIAASLNATEMARRQFREISRIAGLVFRGYPGRPARERSLQASSQLLFDVFRRYDPENLLYQQAFREVFAQRMEEERLRLLLRRIATQELLVKEVDRFTPFSFPIMVDRLRDRLSSEKLEARLLRLQANLRRGPKRGGVEL